MKNSNLSILKNIYYSVFANLITMLISVLLTILVPKFLSITDYSYWQLYIFYSSFVGFFHFGLIDGIYLRLGGENYSSIDHASLKSQFYLLMLFEIFVGSVICFILFRTNVPIDRMFVLFFTVISGIITIGRTFFLYIFQATNRIKEFSFLTRLDRYIYVVLVIIYIYSGNRNFVVLIAMDCFSKLISFVYNMYLCKDILKSKFTSIKTTSLEIIENISIGSKLMFGNIAGQLVIGIVRLSIEKKWNIEVFGKVSLTLSITTMFLTFITAIGIVLFPMLRRMDETRLRILYTRLDRIFLFFSFSLLLLYYPGRYILSIWLPQYKDSLYYMGLLFPMFIYEGKQILLVNTYLKAYRLEKVIFKSNTITLLSSLLISGATVFVFGNLKLTIFAILFLSTLRLLISEKELIQILNIKNYRFPIEQYIFPLAFSIYNIFMSMKSSIIIYSLMLFIYYIKKRGEVREDLLFFKNRIR